MKLKSSAVGYIIALLFCVVTHGVGHAQSIGGSKSHIPLGMPSDSSMTSSSDSGAPTGPFEASFDCAKPIGPMEKLICSNAELAASDRDLAILWTSALGSYQGQLKESLIKGQQTWLQLRDLACTRNPLDSPTQAAAACLTAVYKQRTKVLTKQLEAHRRVALVDFDKILDTPRKLSLYNPVQLGALHQKKDDDIDVNVSHLPQTCRELGELQAGNWTYTNDTIGIQSSSFALTTCGYEVIAGLFDPKHPIPSKVRASIEKQFDARVGLIADEVEHHDIKRFLVGDFTRQNKDQIVAIVFSHDEGTLSFFNLYFGTYDKSQDQLITDEVTGLLTFPDILPE